MKKIGVLPYLKKRDILNDSNADPQQLKKLGDVYFSLDFLHDAMDFYEKAKDLSGVEAILGKALEDGDFFLVKQACKILGRNFSREDWFKLAKHAEEKGKFFFALEAYREAGAQDDAGRISITTAALLNESSKQDLDMADSGA